MGDNILMSFFLDSHSSLFKNYSVFLDYEECVAVLILIDGNLAVDIGNVQHTFVLLCKQLSKPLRNQKF